MNYTDDQLRELNQTCAVRAMGWKLENYETGKKAKSPADYRDAAKNDGWAWVGRPGDFEAWQWQPANDPVSAMELLNRLAEVTDISTKRPFYHEDQKEMFTIRNGDLGDIWVKAETFELALVLFAQKIFA